MLLFLSGCTQKAVTVKSPVTVPLLHMEVINIPTAGVVKILHGDVLLRKENSNMYTKVYPTFIVSFGDMVELTRGASIKIIFQNDAPIIIPQVDKNTWYIFKKAADTKQK